MFLGIVRFFNRQHLIAYIVLRRINDGRKLIAWRLQYEIALSRNNSTLKLFMDYLGWSTSPLCVFMVVDTLSQRLCYRWVPSFYQLKGDVSKLILSGALAVTTMTRGVILQRPEPMTI